MRYPFIKIMPIGLILPLLIVLSCTKNDDCCVNIDVDVQIHYTTQEGDNLINSSEEYNESNIRIYYLNGSEYEYVFKSNLDYPNMHYVSEDQTGDLLLTVFPSDYYSNNFSTTLIQLNENTADTLVCEFNLEGNNQVCTGAWLNGVKFDDRFLEINK